MNGHGLLNTELDVKLEFLYPNLSDNDAYNESTDHCAAAAAAFT